MTVSLHGLILEPGGLTPAVGTVRFRILQELRDTVSNVVYSPDTYLMPLDGSGEFTFPALPVTDNPDISPIDWVYEVWVDTNVWREKFYVSLPTALGPVAEFADLPVMDFDPCTGLISAVGVSPVHTHNQYVLKTGDTMTGSLTLAGGTSDLTVGGRITTTFAGMAMRVGEALSTVLSTGLLSGGSITVNAGNPGLVDISAAVGYIVGGTPTSPTLTRIEYPGVVGTAPLAGSITYYSLDAAGTLLKSVTRWNDSQRRATIVLGATSVVAGVIVANRSFPQILRQPVAQLYDLADALAPFSSLGNIISPNGANLMINKSAGRLFAAGFDYIQTFDSPHLHTTPAQTPMQFTQATRVPGSASGVPTTVLDVVNYDNGGVVTPLPAAGNAQIHRVFLFATSAAVSVAIQRGQIVYASLAAARDAIGAGTFVTNPDFVGNGALIGFIIATRAATALNNTAQALMFPTGKFDQP